MPLSLSDVLAKFPQEVLDRYDFSNAVYHDALKPITGIICAEHGEFKQYSAQLRKNAAGCPACGDVVRRGKKRLPQDVVIQRFKEVHGGFYNYDKVVYRNSITKVMVVCPVHGDFDTTPSDHLKGRGCPTCGGLERGKRRDPYAAARKTADTKLARFADTFEQQAREVHGDTYDYSEVVYAGRQTKVTIVCPKHGPFEQHPQHHLSRGQGCPSCGNVRSRGESEIAAFVGIFAPDAATRDRKIIAPKELDIVVPSAGLAIEYCGEYWHAASSVEDERQNWRRHADKHHACAEQGLRLLTIYESEWRERQAPIKRLIRGALGKMRGSLMARKCDLRRVPTREAAAFFEKYHPQGGTGHGTHYGLYHGGKLVACMRFTMGINDRGAYADRMWTLSRYATRVRVVGGASRLFAAFVDEYQPDAVKSFSDNRYFTGGMYARLGFVMEAETKPEYQVFHPKLGLMAKASWQRSRIPALIRKIGSKEVFDPNTDPRSERDMTYLLGGMRLFDCGKKRWVWRK